jgi:phospholipid/cholesterol/gamma-HCH transport system substrate-binding protein
LCSWKPTPNMKINNEVKVGLLTIAALVMLILGFNFLKGKDLFNRSKKIYAVFNQLGSLATSNDVKINGLTVGKVYEMEETDEHVSGIRVTISLTRDVAIPENSVAYISAPLVGLGSSAIIIEKGDASTYLKDGDEIKTREDEGLLGGLSAELTPTIAKIRTALDSLTLVFSNINKLFDSQTKGNLQELIANLNTASRSLDKMLDSENGALAKTLNNASSFTDNLKKNNDSITAILSNAKQFTNTLTQLELKQTVDSLQATIGYLKNVSQKLASNEGTVGALLNDRQVYDKLNNLVLSAEILLDDIRLHPKRYVNISVFGKKDKSGALTSPATKDDKSQR